MGGMGLMVMVGHRFSKSTFRANKVRGDGTMVLMFIISFS